jgi:PAS domain S-box-containing protein
MTVLRRGGGDSGRTGVRTVRVDGTDEAPEVRQAAPSRDSAAGSEPPSAGSYECAATDRLERRLELSDAIVGSIAEGILAVDRENRLTFVNPVAEKLLGRSSDELIGRHVHDVAHIGDDVGAMRPASACRIQSVLTSGQTVTLDDQFFIRADGTIFPVALTCSPLLRNGDIVGAVTVFRDDSEHRRHRKELHRSEERLRRSLTSAGMVVWERDFETGRTVRSDLASTLYGRPSEELVDDPESHLRLVHPDDRERLAELVNGAVEAEGGYQIEYRVIWPDGTVRWLAGRASVFRDRDGSPRGLSGTTHDITARKMAELELSRLLEERQAEAAELRELHRRLKETAQENVRLYREVAKSEQALRRLVHKLMVAQEEERRRLAYEIHDGVAQMASGVQQLVEAYAHDFPGPSEAARHRMEVASGLARRTVAEIRRVLAGLRPAVLDDFGLARGLRAYAEGLRAECLVVDFVESVGSERLPPDVEIALFRLAQEALTNVRKHAGVGTARLGLDRSGNRVVLEVEDRGRGFDLASVGRSDRPGERLGLLSMQERIAQIGGTLEIRSRRCEGTLVRAVVPVVDAPERPRRRRD